MLGIKVEEIVLSLIIAGVIIVLAFQNSTFDNNTRFVMCDVGQGDGMYLRINNKIDMLIDAGPSSKILNCLGKYMPFFDKKIEFAILTHAQKDHYGGYLNVLNHYQIDQFITNPVTNKGQTYLSFLEKLKERKIPIYFAYSQDQLIIDDSRLIFLWPDRNFIELHSSLIGDGLFRSPESNFDLNESSLIFTFTDEKVTFLFTGDTTSKILNRLSQRSITNIDVLKVPHHGSRYGLNSKTVKLADPILSLISSGKNNSYHHPSKEVLQILRATNTKILRTDTNGDIKIKLNKGEIKLF